MAQRLYVSGFSLEAMFALMGSGDDALAARLAVEFDTLVQPPDSGARERTFEVLRRTVRERPRRGDVQIERDEHAYAALVMARHGQSHLEADPRGWEMDAVWEFVNHHRGRSQWAPGLTLTILSSGRCLFAKCRKASLNRYGYMTHEQVQVLLTGLRRLRARLSRGGSGFVNGFGDALVGWLESIESAGLDLWSYQD